MAATHGRSLWVLDVTALRQMSTESVQESIRLYAPGATIIWRSQPRMGRSRTFLGENPSSGADIYYSLHQSAREVTLKITTEAGEPLRELNGSGEPGLHRVSWDLRQASPRGGGNNHRGRRFRRARRVSPGTYGITLEVDGQKREGTLVVNIDPDFTDVTWLQYRDRGDSPG